MKFGHVSMVARDIDRLAEFYKTVFGCEDTVPRWTMSGEHIARGIGLADCEIYAAWLSLPGVEGPFLEIFQYTSTEERPAPMVNQPGYGHICFQVDNIEAAVDAVVLAGGTALGEVTELGTKDAPVLCVYVRDPEGNVVELEQH